MSNYCNYHKHTHYSNLRTQDSIIKPIQYIQRAKELGQNIYFTTEHGWQGNIFEAYTLCQENGLKCVYGVEAYYVDDSSDKTERTSYHIILIAMTEKGRREINKIISRANTEGFYYKPRIDLNDLLSLSPSDTVVTTACVASRMFKGEDWENKFLLPVFNHFKDNFYLEVQSHQAEIQKQYNKQILEVSRQYNIPIIHANDSHYIYPSDNKYRDLYLKAKGIEYAEEIGFTLDYPSYDEIVERYRQQGVLNEREIESALRNTLIFEKSEGITLDKEFKIPKVIEGDSNKNLKKILSQAWKEEKQKIKPEKHKEYENAIRYETDIVEKCGMADYFLLDHFIVKKAVEEYGAILTRSGRGSAVSFYINKLLGLTEVDRIKAPITLYPTRFMSEERILQSRSLPDIDLNFANIEPVVKASKDYLGEDGIYYMVAYKPLQESSAFRLWCKANNYNIDEYDEIAKHIEDYIDNAKWGKVIESSKIFRGVIESVAPSPCSFLLLSKPISEEIGLIKVGDITCCCLDGYNCDVYKYLKNDFLTVTVYGIISKVYDLIGRPIDNISTLINNCDDKVWDIYAKGLTTTINQSDSDYAKPMLKRYAPKNLAEMSAWVAAIRPSFASLLNNFLDRKDYTTGVPELDELLSDSFHYLMYQESIMKYLVWLGIEEKVTYDIIKKISKKKFKEEELKELEEKLRVAWIQKLGTEDRFKETFQVVMDAAAYGFNASHSLSVAIDSIYGAYLKSHYPLEYFTVALTTYIGDLERTSNLIAELPYFNITLKSIQFGKSSADYTMDKATNSIYKGIASIKNCNAKIAEELMELSHNNYSNFFELLADIKTKTSVNSKQREILIGLNFFSQFGENQYLLNLAEIYDKFSTCKIIKKSKLEELGLTETLMLKYSAKETASQYSGINNIGLIQALASKVPHKSMGIVNQVKFEKEYLNYVTYANPDINKEYYIVTDYEERKTVGKPRLTLHNLATGNEISTKVKHAKYFKENPFGQYSVIKTSGCDYEFKVRPDANGKWVETNETEPILNHWEVIKK